MVGVPRSTGCHLCLKRRVKCDGSRPGCGNCVKYGTECPGYAREIKFVSGKHQIRSKRRGDEASPSVEHPAQGSEAIVVDPFASAAGWRPGLLTKVPKDNRAQFICTMIDGLRSDQGKEELSAFEVVFIMLPERLGHKVTIDSAMCALALHLLGKATKDDNLLHKSQVLYTQSLGALQAALSHPVEWKASDTLCSAMVLCFFELFAGTSDSQSWMKHASGIADLMERRGPESYRDGIDAAMLMSFKGIIIMNYMFSPDSKACFLSEKRWKRVMRDNGRRLLTGDRTVPLKHFDIVDDYFELLANVPTILYWGFLLREANRHKMPVDKEGVKKLAKAASDLRQGFLRWHDTIEPHAFPMREVPSKDPSSIFETVYEYDHYWTAVFRLGYWATMIILQETLSQCGWHENFEECNRDFTLRILRSIETVAGDSLFGPMRVGYAIRIAYEFTDIRGQTWVRMWLDRFSKRYAATTKITYPAPKQNEYMYS